MAESLTRVPRAVKTASIRDTERAGIDVITDGEIRRESYSNRFATGADVIQLDEPWLQARADEARRLALPAIDAALDGIPGPTALHLCFGYAYVARDKPNRYAFLPELTASKVEQISIEAAQPNLELTTLDGLGDKTVIFGVISMADPEPETPETVAARIRAALAHLPPERLIHAPDCGMKYIPRETAFAKLKAFAEVAEIARRELAGA
jgi:5-methyltetrahydropteroyltriglutamate--homocysteine methyltransferase